MGREDVKEERERKSVHRPLGPVGQDKTDTLLS